MPRSNSSILPAASAAAEHVVTIALYHRDFGRIPCGSYVFRGTRRAAFANGRAVGEHQNRRFGAERVIVSVLS